MSITSAEEPNCTTNAPLVEPGAIPPDCCVSQSVGSSEPRGPLGSMRPLKEAPVFVAGRQLGIVVSGGSSRQLVEHVKRRFESLGASAELVVPAHSDRLFDDRTEIEASHTLEEKPATEFDFIVMLPGLDTPQPLGDVITQWAIPLRYQDKPIAIGAQAAERLGVDIDSAHVFDVSTCDAFVQACLDRC